MVTLLITGLNSVLYNFVLVITRALEGISEEKINQEFDVESENPENRFTNYHCFIKENRNELQFYLPNLFPKASMADSTIKSQDIFT